jgi:hypothetical protein
MTRDTTDLMPILLALTPLVLAGCSEWPPASKPDAVPDHPAWFIDAAPATGLNFTHVNGAAGELYYPEILPPGVALFDFDRDGDLDVYVVQGHGLGSKRGAVPAAAAGRLFRNDLAVRDDGRRDLKFVDVTAASGLIATGYGNGVATGDIDNDGWVDVYVTQFGGCRLFRNNGDGTFGTSPRSAARPTRTGMEYPRRLSISIGTAGWTCMSATTSGIASTTGPCAQIRPACRTTVRRRSMAGCRIVCIATSGAASSSTSHGRP